MKKLLTSLLSILLVLTLCPVFAEAENTVRLSGKGRYETSMEVAEELMRVKGIDHFDTVVLATGKNYADALGGGYLASKKEAPILLTSDGKYSEVNAFIQKNLKEGGTVYVLGGTGAVSEVCLNGLEAFNVKRLYGKNRYNTNMAILNEAGVTDEDILVCTGKNYADSLAASASGRPMLLVSDKLNDEQKAFLEEHRNNEKYIIGGTGAVSASVEAEVSAYGAPTRISGQGRYETAVAIANTFCADPDQVVLAYSHDYPDGLCAGPLANALGAPILLLKEGKESAAQSYTNSHSIEEGYICGGDGRIPENSVNIVFNEETPVQDELAGTYNITVWTPVTGGVKELIQEKINAFMAANPGIVINVTVEAVSEGEAGSQMLQDVEKGADLFWFTQDQTERLARAGSLVPLGEEDSTLVRQRNDEKSIEAASYNGKLYGYPTTSDNGYFMYYDKSVISEDIVDSLEDILKACEDNSRLFDMEYSTSAWYNASFFFATGCVSEWQIDSSGNIVSVHDTYNSPEGLIAMKGLEKVAKSPAASNSSMADDFANGAAVVVSGTWSDYTAKEILGDNMGVADLPSFTVDGKSYHMGSFYGGKVLGVKPQTEVKKSGVLRRLALYLTDAEAQMDYYTRLYFLPSNLTVQRSQTVQADSAARALIEQNKYSTVQRQIYGSWWSIAQVLGDEAKNAKSDADLQKALDDYSEMIESALPFDGYVFVGNWNGWNNSDKETALFEKNGNTLTLTIDVPESDYMGGRIVSYGEWGTDMGCQQVTVGADLIEPYDAQNNIDNNIIFLSPGNYTITADLSIKEIRIVKNS
ncbi:MAG: extracellular solute-binding protein [Erysipelotrichaceae bacterium]|nr:extracellular solute-binding protein [Erysipelotrichaceae bacterium]